MTSMRCCSSVIPRQGRALADATRKSLRTHRSQTTPCGTPSMTVSGVSRFSCSSMCCDRQKNPAAPPTTSSLLRDAKELSDLLSENHEQEMLLYQRRLSQHERRAVPKELCTTLRQLAGKADLLSHGELALLAEISAVRGLQTKECSQISQKIIRAIASATRRRWESDEVAVDSASGANGIQSSGMASASAADPESIAWWPKGSARGSSLVRFSKAAAAAIRHAARTGASSIGGLPDETEWLAAFAASGISAAARDIPKMGSGGKSIEEGGEAEEAAEGEGAPGRGVGGGYGTGLGPVPGVGTLAVGRGARLPPDLRDLVEALDALRPHGGGAQDGGGIQSSAGDSVVGAGTGRREAELVTEWMGPYFVGATRAVGAALGRLSSKAVVVRLMEESGLAGRRGQGRTVVQTEAEAGLVAAGTERERRPLAAAQGVELTAVLGQCMLEARQTAMALGLPPPAPRLVTQSGGASPWAGLSRLARWAIRSGSRADVGQLGGHRLALPLAESVLALRTASIAASLAKRGGQNEEGQAPAIDDGTVPLRSDSWHAGALGTSSGELSGDRIPWPQEQAMQMSVLPAIIGSNATGDEFSKGGGRGVSGASDSFLAVAIGAASSWLRGRLGLSGATGAVIGRAVTAARLYPAVDVWQSGPVAGDGLGPWGVAGPATAEQAQESISQQGPRQATGHKEDALWLLLRHAEDAATSLVEEWKASAWSKDISYSSGSEAAHSASDADGMLMDVPSGMERNRHLLHGRGGESTAESAAWSLGPWQPLPGQGASVTQDDKVPPPASEDGALQELNSDKTILKEMPEWLQRGVVSEPPAGQSHSIGNSDSTSAQGWNSLDAHIPASLAQALIQRRREEVGRIGVSPVYAASEIERAVKEVQKSLSEADSRVALSGSTQEPQVRVKLGGSGREEVNTGMEESGDTVKVGDVCIQGSFAILRRLRSGLGKEVDDLEGERWMLQWPRDQDLGSEFALCRQREGRMPWEAEFDLDWSAPEASRKAEPMHPTHMMLGATADGILPEEMGVEGSHRDPVYVPASIFAGVDEVGLLERHAPWAAAGGGAFAPGRRHGESLWLRKRRALLSLAERQPVDPEVAERIAMDAHGIEDEEELLEWATGEDSRAAGEARSRHLLECLEADWEAEESTRTKFDTDIERSNSAVDDAASIERGDTFRRGISQTQQWSSAADALARAEMALDSDSGKIEKMLAKNGEISLSKQGQQLGNAWLQLTMAGVTQQAERFPELAPPGVTYNANKPSWNAQRSWPAAEKRLLQTLGLPPRQRMVPGESIREQGDTPTVPVEDRRADVLSLEQEISSAQQQGGSNASPSSAIAALVLQVVAGQLQASGRSAAEQAAALACSQSHSPDHSDDSTRNLELLRHAADGPLVAVGCDIAAWYGADATPALRHLVHCIADEVLCRRGPRLAAEQPGLLAAALRGLGHVAAGSWSEHGVDVVAARGIQQMAEEAEGGEPEAVGAQASRIHIRGFVGHDYAQHRAHDGDDCSDGGKRTAAQIKRAASDVADSQREWSQDLSTGRVVTGAEAAAGLRGRTAPSGEWHPLGFPQEAAVPQRSKVGAVQARRALRAACEAFVRAIARETNGSSAAERAELAWELVVWAASSSDVLSQGSSDGTIDSMMARWASRAPGDEVDAALVPLLGGTTEGKASVSASVRVPHAAARVLLSLVRAGCKARSLVSDASKIEISEGLHCASAPAALDPPSVRVRVDLGAKLPGDTPAQSVGKRARSLAEARTTCDQAAEALASVTRCSLEVGLEQLPDVALPSSVCEAAVRLALMGARSDNEEAALGPLADAGWAVLAAAGQGRGNAKASAMGDRGTSVDDMIRSVMTGAYSRC